MPPSWSALLTYPSKAAWAAEGAATTCKQNIVSGHVSSAACVQAIFRAALLPHPKVNPQSFPPSAAAFAASALLPLIIFVAYHLVRHRPTQICVCLHPYHHMINNREYEELPGGSANH